MPRQEIKRITANIQSTDPILTATWLGHKLFVSRKSALLRLVEIGVAQWDDFQRLDSSFEKKKRGGRPDPNKTRTRDVVRRDTYGSCLSTVHDAYRAGFVSEADIRAYLRVYPEELT